MASNVCWGIEVGAGGVKALKVERDGDSLRVADFVVMPHKRVLSTPGIDKDEATRLALGSLMSQYRDAMRGSTIALSVPGHSAFARFAKLPPVEPKGVAGLVKFEAVQQIPFPIDDVEWDYQTFASEDSPEVEVGIFASTKERMNEMLSLYSEVGLTPDIINLSPVSVYNALAYDLAFTDQTPGTVIVDIGTTATDLIIADHGKVWMRTFPLGGHQFTEKIAETFKLDYVKAEKLKREAETSKYKKHIFQSLKPVLSELVQDIQRSIGYYKDTHPEANIQRVIGCGATFKLMGLRKLLSQQLQMDVYRLERYKRLNIEGSESADFEAASTMMATSYGLALQGLGLETINANLMPVPVIRKALWKRKTKVFAVAAGMGLAAGGLMFLQPFLESAEVDAARADPSNTRPINDAIRTGGDLKGKWSEVESIEGPGFVAQNVLALATGKDLYAEVLADVSNMLSDAQRKAPVGADELGVRLASFNTEYVKPGTSLLVSSMPQGDDGGRRRRRANDDAQAAEGPVAGERGGLLVTLVVDSSADDRAFLNESFLSWLRNNQQRTGVTYTFESIPGPTDVPIVEFEGDGPPPSSPSSPSRRRGGGGPPPGDDSDPTDSGGGNPPPPPSRDRAPRGADSSELDTIAPIPAEAIKPRPAGTLYRYTINWSVQIRTPAEMEAEAMEADTDATADAGAPTNEEASS